MKKVEYLPTITLGNIVSILTMLGALAGLYLTHDRRITILEGSNSALVTAVTKVSTAQENSTRALDRLTYIIEDKSKRLTQ